MTLTILNENNTVILNNEPLEFDYELDANIWAVQWNGNSGHIEYADDTPNEEITDISQFQSVIEAYNAKVAEMAHQNIDDENAPISLEELREERNRRLGETDWTQVVDSALSAEEQAKYATYRQALRDMTNGYSPTAPQNIVFPTL